MPDEYTWDEAILLVLRESHGRASLQEIYQRISAYKSLSTKRRAAPQETAGGRPAFHQTVRKILSVMCDKRDLVREGKAVYALADSGWRQLASIVAAPFAFPEEYREPEVITEGAVHRVLVNAYERSPEARRKCIEHHGAACSVCGMTFGSVYGEMADGFIHVHHLKPLSEIGEEYEVDPVADLRPVCPNCHAVIHLGNASRTIEEVRQLVRSCAPPNPALHLTAAR
jgi:predicted HNH restriction endonuclease